MRSRSFDDIRTHFPSCLLGKKIFITYEYGIRYFCTQTQTNPSFCSGNQDSNYPILLEKETKNKWIWPRNSSEGFFSRCYLSIGHFRITSGLLFKASPGAHCFMWKLVFICMWMIADFHMKGWAPGLALKKRPMVIRKWPSHWWALHVYSRSKSVPLDRIF